MTFIELFFDLVSVFAVTQLAHYLLEHPDGSGLVEATLLLVAVWWAWVHTTWLTSYLDPDALRVRLLLIGLVVAGLFAATALPRAFGDRGLWFALAYVATLVARPSSWLLTSTAATGYVGRMS